MTLVAHWIFDNSLHGGVLTDEVSLVGATLSGSPSFGADTYPCLTLVSGSSQYVNTNIATNFKPPITILARMKGIAISGNPVIIGRLKTTPTYAGQWWDIFSNDYHMRYGFFKDTSGGDADVNSPASTYEGPGWFDYAVTCDGRYVKFYKVAAGGSTSQLGTTQDFGATYAPIDESENWFIGARNNGGAPELYLDTKFALLKIYDVVLSAAEIDAAFSGVVTLTIPEMESACQQPIQQPYVPKYEVVDY